MPTKKILKRSEVDDKFKWSLENLFPTDEQWNDTYNLISDKLSALSAFQGKLEESSDSLLKCLALSDEISVTLDRLYVYSNMRLHQDSTNAYYQAQSNRAEMLVINFMGHTSFIIPEITELRPEVLKKFLTENNKLKVYEHFIENIVRKNTHVLSKKEEALLAKTEEMSNAPQDIFAMINDADIKFPNIKNEDGEDVQLTKGRYVTMMESNDVNVRKSAFEALYDTYIKQKNTLAQTYYSSVKKDVFYAQVRNYPSALAQALDDDNIPVSVYDNLVESVHKYLPLMHRYVKIRKKLLGVDELHMYDLYAPLVEDADITINYEDAKKKVAEALAPMGQNYVNALNEGFNGGWIDIYENEGKRGGAYSWGTFSGHPYVLLNHADNINSMFTLAHEMGHALHSYFTWKKQPYIYSGHKIFVAEVASTCNEALLMEHMLKTTTDKTARKYLINYFLEQFKGTFFRQTMFAEFERITHKMVEDGQPLTCEELCKIYRSLNKQYFGDDVVLDDRIDMEWARIPHFYNAFYVYQYATGYSAAIALSRKILAEGQTAVDAYLDFLSKGNSEYSIDLLKGAGVDMTTCQPFENAMAVFEDLLNKMEAEL
ncbi:MAG TPA: oligoendopeptidase F [Lachnospiraceae bacterium]|nr:oligoendopeptidase F [Lachnospiraceae bacterium]